LNIVNHDVRQAIANAERAVARSSNPTAAFADQLSNEILGKEGMRNRYLGQADSRRSTFDLTAPLTSIEQASILNSGGLTNDLDKGPTDGDPSFKKRD
jgi:conjugal transfer mating pair stabilization protein TraG